jgi:hypothetical protein
LRVCHSERKSRNLKNFLRDPRRNCRYKDFMHRQKRLTESYRITAPPLVLLLLLCGFATAQETTPISALEVKYRKQIFANDRFAVFLLEIPPNHATLMHRHDTDILSIFVSGGETISTIFGKPPKEDRFAVGEVRFRSAGFTHQPRTWAQIRFAV